MYDRALTDPPYPVPDHIDPAKVIDFDFYQVPEHGVFHDHLGRAMESLPPIFYTPRNGGHWVVAGYDAVVHISRSPDTFSSTKQVLPPVEPAPSLIPIALDPPTHTLFRQPLAKAFSASRMIERQREIRELAIDLIEKVKDKGGCEFVREIAAPLPVHFFLGLINMPLERADEYCGWVHSINQESDATAKGTAYARLHDEVAAIIADRRINPQDDLFSELMAADVGGRVSTEDELVSYGMMLFLAGLDTVTAAMTYGVRHLCLNPELQSHLRAHPEDIASASEELLRLYGFALPGRMVTKDVSYGGVNFRAGDRLLLFTAAGNLDPAAFSNPREVIIDRKEKSHLAFNSGQHRCLGMNLARLELRIFYEEWLARIPRFALDESVPSVLKGGHVLAIQNLSLLFD